MAGYHATKLINASKSGHHSVMNLTPKQQGQACSQSRVITLTFSPPVFTARDGLVRYDGIKMQTSQSEEPENDLWDSWGKCDDREQLEEHRGPDMRSREGYLDSVGSVSRMARL